MPGRTLPHLSESLSHPLSPHFTILTFSYPIKGVLLLYRGLPGGLSLATCVSIKKESGSFFYLAY